MNKLVLGLLIGAAIGGGAMWLWKSHPTAVEALKTEAAAKTEEKPNPLRLNPEQRTKAGFVLTKPTAGTITPEVTGYAKVIDASSLAMITSNWKPLAALWTHPRKGATHKLFAAGGNASAQAVEAAQAAVARDNAAVGSAQVRLSATWGRELVKNVAAITEALEHGGALVRVDLLPGEITAEALKEAKLTLPGANQSFSAEVIGAAPTADAQVQGLSFLALAKDHPLPVGAALRASLAGVGETASALTIPRSAVVYHQGSPWIFVLGEEDTFERKIVSLGRALEGDRIAVLSGIDPDEQVVAVGAQQLLSAELQAGGAAEP